jgi:hypothetical protein
MRTWLSLAITAAALVACSAAPQAGPPEAALLAAADLPDGWVASDVEFLPAAGEAGGGAFLCESLDVGGTAQWEAAFENGDLGPWLVETLTQYAPGETEAALAQMADVSARCTAWTAALEDGTSQEWRAERLPDPALGESGLRLLLYTDLGMGRLQFDTHTLRHGNWLLTLHYITFGPKPPPPETSEGYARLAFNKLFDTLAP